MKVLSMRLLFSLGQHAALRIVQWQLQLGELVFGYVVTTLDSDLAVYSVQSCSACAAQEKNGR